MLDSALVYGWRADSPYLLALAVLFALLAARASAESARSVLRTLTLLVAGTVGQFGAGLLAALGMISGARVLYEICLLYTSDAADE